jgi:polyphosphate kinase 2 (PPK2 family)
MKHINHFEHLLQLNNTIVLKFYLHLSRTEQHKRLHERMNDVRKQWKYNEKDWKESELWDDYMKCYEAVIEQCSEAAPWHIIPSDHNWVKEYLVFKIIVDTLQKLPLSYPTVK